MKIKVDESFIKSLVELKKESSCIYDTCKRYDVNEPDGCICGLFINNEPLKGCFEAKRKVGKNGENK